MLGKLEKIVTLLENIIGSFFLIAMVIIVALQVFSRYAMETPISWTEEGARYCLIWLTFIGSAMAIRTKGHFAVELLIQKIPHWLSRYAELLLLLIALSFMVVLMSESLSVVQVVHHQMSAAMQIPMSYVYVAIPIGASFMIIHSLVLICAKTSEILASKSCGHSEDLKVAPDRRIDL